MHAARLLIYQIVIVTCQYCTGLGVVILMSLEIGKAVWMFSLRQKGVLKSTILVLAEGNQSLFMIIFLFITGVVHPYGSRDKVAAGWQDLGRFTILAAVGCEFIILLTIICQQIVAIYRKRIEKVKQIRE